MDLTVANRFSDDVSILLGDGDGTFTQAAESPVTVGTAPAYVVTGDFDGDGMLNLVVTNFSSNNLFILLGDGDVPLLKQQNLQ